MGLGDFLLRGIAIDVAIDVVSGVAQKVYVGATKGIDYISEKKEEHEIKKLRKSKQKIFYISFDRDDRTILNKHKARYYVVQDNETIKYRVKRVIKSERTSLSEIYEGNKKDLSVTINEIVNMSGGNVFLILGRDKNEIARVLSGDAGPYRFITAKDKIAWDIIKPDKDYIISKNGNIIARCKLQSLYKPSIAVTHIEDMPSSIILFIALCILFSVERKL